ncbi:FH protein interacting protein FIP2 [Pelomyxa schiedti]|nr:FH protein interacting protein FIP2 [Pelomyxa schiedti]
MSAVGTSVVGPGGTSTPARPNLTATAPATATSTTGLSEIPPPTTPPGTPTTPTIIIPTSTAAAVATAPALAPGATATNTATGTPTGTTTTPATTTTTTTTTSTPSSGGGGGGAGANFVIGRVRANTLRRSCDLVPDVLRLNVGGTVFVTARRTLCLDENSMLARMFNSSLRASATDDSGAYFLDRDPVYFRVVLNFLRTGRLLLDSGVSLDGVLMEAEFFQIDSLVRAVDISSRPDLTRTDFIQMAPRSKFERLRLQNLDLSGLELEPSTSFMKSILSGASFTSCIATRPNFSKSQGDDLNFANAVFDQPKFTKCKFHNSNFSSLSCISGVFLTSDLRNCTFTNAQLHKGCLFQRAILHGCSFEGATLHQAKFQDADLTNANFTNASLLECHLTDSDLRGAIIDWENVINCKAYTRQALVSKVEFEKIPEAFRDTLGLVVLDPLPVDHPFLTQIDVEVKSTSICVYTQLVTTAPEMKKFCEVFQSIGVLDQVTWVITTDRPPQFESALVQYTRKQYFPKVFVSGNYVAGCERLFYGSAFDILKAVLTKAVARARNQAIPKPPKQLP